MSRNQREPLSFPDKEVLGASAPLDVLLKAGKWSNENLPTLTLSWGCLVCWKKLKVRISPSSSHKGSREWSLMLKKKREGSTTQSLGRRRAMTLPCLPAQCPGSVCHGADEISCIRMCVWQGQQSPLIHPGRGSDILLPVHYDKQILNLLFPDLFCNRRQLGEACP